MKINILLFILLLELIYIGWQDKPLVFYAEETQSKVSPTPVLTKTPTPTPVPLSYIPVRLIIPKLGIDTTLQTTGISDKGKMEVPTDYFRAGWFGWSAKAGESFTSVIAGHYDTSTGAPALFYSLSALSNGDEMKLLDEKGREFRYKVVKKETYDIGTIPVDEIFYARGKPMLNLITCNGWFNTSLQTYSHRTVVFTELVN